MDHLKKSSLAYCKYFYLDTVITVQFSFTIISVSNCTYIAVTKIQLVMKRGGLSHFLEDLEISLSWLMVETEGDEICLVGRAEGGPM
jgi:hypothetical protein